MPLRRSPRRGRLAAMAASVTAATIVSGCATAGLTEDGSPTVIAAFYPWAWLSEQITGDAVEVRSLAEAGTDPHDLELTARQVVDVERAMLVVYARGMQPAVDEAVEQHAEGHALDAATVVETLPVPNGPGGTSEAQHEHADGDQGGHASFDPHIWLDPVRFAAVAEELGGRLAELDPAHADGYRQRTRQLVDRLTELDEAYRSSLDSCRSRTVVTSHESFGYLTDRYGLEQIGVAGLDPHAPPSPSRLAEVARLVENEDVEVVFLERLTDPEATKTLAGEVGARTAVLDPLAALREGPGQDYVSVMRTNLATLRDALGCS